MAEQVLKYSNVKDLKCGCIPFDVILCVPVDLVAEDVPQNEEQGFVTASVVEKCLKTVAGATYSIYTLKYDDIQLASYDEEEEEATELLHTMDIGGIFCDDCLLDYLKTFID